MATSNPPARPVDPAQVTVVVPVGGAAPYWNRSAASLARLDPAPGEIVAVIDGPHEEPAARAAEIGARVLVLDERGGPARARNHGARAAGGEILLFVDADVELPRDLVARVAALFTADAGLSAVIGSYDDAPAAPGLVSRYRNLLHHAVHQSGREEASTFWAGCGAVRRRTFLEAGGFDECYPVPSIEDIELGSRLVHSGNAIRMVKDLQVKHLKRWRLGNMLATDLLRRAVPWTRLMLRQRRLVNDLNVKTRERVAVAAAFVAPLALAAAWWWPALLAVAAAAALLVLALNARLFALFLRRRGPLFALATIPLHWLYLLTCGAGFGLGLLRHLLSRGR